MRTHKSQAEGGRPATIPYSSPLIPHTDTHIHMNTHPSTHTHMCSHTQISGRYAHTSGWWGSGDEGKWRRTGRCSSTFTEPTVTDCDVNKSRTIKPSDSAALVCRRTGPVNLFPWRLLPPDRMREGGRRRDGGTQSVTQSDTQTVNENQRVQVLANKVIATKDKASDEKEPQGGGGRSLSTLPYAMFTQSSWG